MIECRPCLDLQCDLPDDLNSGGGIFSLVGYSFVVACPPGFYCFLESQTVTFPPDSIPPVRVPPPFSGIITLRLQGCQSEIVRVLPATATAAEINAAVASMQAEWAGQQAICNVISPPPPGSPGSPVPPSIPPISLPPPSTQPPALRVDVKNTAQSFTASCTPPAIGSPVTVTVAAGTYSITVLNATAAKVALAQSQVNAFALADATAQANAALACSSLCPTILASINALALLQGHVCYAPIPTPNPSGRSNLVFASRISDIIWIDNLTVQPGSISFPGETPLRLVYADSVNRIYAFINSVPCYVAVINPDTQVVVTTFTNGVSQDFQYGRYAPAKDRIYCLQSNNPVINLIVIDPNTNTITNTVPYGDIPTDQNFNAGVDYCPVNDRIYIGRQGFTNPADQLIRVFDGTALTPVVDINIATLQPYDLVYCSDFNKVCVGCQDYFTVDNAVLIIDCATNTVVGNVTIPPGLVPSTVAYNPQTKQLFADCGDFLYVIDIPTATITCAVAVVGQSLSMAFNASNNRMYRPGTGTLFIDTLG